MRTKEKPVIQKVRVSTLKVGMKFTANISPGKGQWARPTLVLVVEKPQPWSFDESKDLIPCRVKNKYGRMVRVVLRPTDEVSAEVAS